VPVDLTDAPGAAGNPIDPAGVPPWLPPAWVPLPGDGEDGPGVLTGGGLTGGGLTGGRLTGGVLTGGTGTDGVGTEGSLGADGAVTEGTLSARPRSGRTPSEATTSRAGRTKPAADRDVRQRRSPDRDRRQHPQLLPMVLHIYPFLRNLNPAYRRRRPAGESAIPERPTPPQPRWPPTCAPRRGRSRHACPRAICARAGRGGRTAARRAPTSRRYRRAR
jgi:hypothetical protein